MKAAVLSCTIGAVFGGQIELISSDLTGSTGAGKVLDNIKGSWSQTLKLLGNDATIEGSYDRSENEKFLKDATLSGKVDDVSYEVKTTFGGETELTLSADTKDGTNIEAIANSKDGIAKLTASRSTKVQGQGIDVEASHSPPSGASKLKLSTVLGHGLKAIATLTGSETKGGYSTEKSFDLEYESDVAGRTVTANVNPQDGTGQIELIDNKSIDATITASLPLGGKPQLSVKRSWSF